VPASSQSRAVARPARMPASRSAFSCHADESLTRKTPVAEGDWAIPYRWPFRRERLPPPGRERLMHFTSLFQSAKSPSTTTVTPASLSTGPARSIPPRIARWPRTIRCSTRGCRDCCAWWCRATACSATVSALDGLRRAQRLTVTMRASTTSATPAPGRVTHKA
jgi:hypothetical protein